MASMKRMSPPTGVQASPVATPGTLVRIATSFSKYGAPNIGVRSPAPMRMCCALPSAILHRGVTQSAPDLPFEISHARLSRVILNNFPQRVVVDLDLFRRSARSPRAGAERDSVWRSPVSPRRYSRQG